MCPGLGAVEQDAEQGKAFPCREYCGGAGPGTQQGARLWIWIWDASLGVCSVVLEWSQGGLGRGVAAIDGR